MHREAAGGLRVVALTLAHSQNRQVSTLIFDIRSVIQSQGLMMYFPSGIWNLDWNLDIPWSNLNGRDRSHGIKHQHTQNQPPATLNQFHSIFLVEGAGLSEIRNLPQHELGLQNTPFEDMLIGGGTARGSAGQ